MPTIPDVAGPSQIPRTGLTSAMPTAPIDACLNFNVPDGRVVCLSVPSPLREADVPFVLSVIQGFVSALARRGS